MNPTLFETKYALLAQRVSYAFVGGVARFLLPAAVLVLVGVTAAVHAARMLASRDLTDHQGDYALFAEMARTLVDGRRIYADYWCGMAPGIYFLLAPFILLLGPTILSVNLATIFIFVLFALASAALAYELTGSRLAALIGGSFALLYASYQKGPETVFALSAIGTLAAWVAVKGRGRLGWMFAAGLIFAGGVITKQPLLIELPALLLLSIWRAPGQRLRVAVAVVAGVAAGGGALLLWAWSQGILNEMLFKTIDVVYQYVFTGDGRWHFTPDAGPLFQRYFLGSALPYLRPLLITAAAMALLVFFTRRYRSALAVLAFWLFCSVVAAVIPRGWRLDYFTQTLPALIAIVTLGVAQAQQMNYRWQAAALLLVLIMANTFSTVYVRPLGGLRLWTMPAEDEVIEQINQRTEKDDCIWTWGSMSYFNFLTERDSCASAAIEGFMMDSTAFPIHLTRVEYMQEMIYRDPALHINQSVWGYFPELQKYADRYRGEMVFQNDRYTVYEVDRSSWHALEAPVNFGGEVALIGYDIFDEPAEVCPGATLQMALTWQQISRPSHEYQVFVQLLTPDEQAKLAGYDGVPVSRRPTYTWVNSGEVILGEPFELSIPETVEAGAYPLVVGLYDVETAETLPVLNLQGQPTGGYTHLQAIAVAGSC